jgi:hypothetical protein
VVITRPVTNDDLALRSSIGLFVFTPPGVNEHFIHTAGFNLLRQQDVSVQRGHRGGPLAARASSPSRRAVAIEGEERFEGLQKFFARFTG